MNVAPVLAASSARLAEKQSVTFTMQPSLESALQVLRPSIVRGTLIATLSAIFRRIAASFTIVSLSIAQTSADTGSSSMPQISSTTTTNLLPDLWIHVVLDRERAV